MDFKLFRCRSWALVAASSLILAMPSESRAEGEEGDALRLVITKARPGFSGVAESASEGVVPGDQLLARPAYRPGELLESTPGLIVTQHSGEGKANQYFLRGFNLDHGTDLAITVDDMPVNMRTHGHAQGYADINFMIPELVRALSYRKGPYSAAEGDFASVGAVHLGYLDELDANIAEISGGSFGYARGLAAASQRLGVGTLTGALEALHNDGPWRNPDDYRKLNGVLRYAQGNQDNGFSVTGMAYGGRWNSTNQVAQRALDSGLIGRFDNLDPSDGGEAQRYSLSGRWSERDADQATRLSAYLIRGELALYNDFTYFLRDPINGDQFKQADSRTVFGTAARKTLFGAIAGRPSEIELGVETRYDDIRVGLFNTRQRNILSTVRDDRVAEASIGFLAQHTLQWTERFRTVLGLREDLFHGDVRSDNPLNSGSATANITSPKLELGFGPFGGNEIYLDVGSGFHSNDLRGATITVDPNDGVTPLRKVPLLVRSKGAEIGLRSRAVRGLESTLAFFVLDFDSELLFTGDSGTTEASRPSRRIGVEWTNFYRPTEWLSLDLDVSYTRARFINDDPAGSYIPGAAQGVIDLGVEIDYVGNWFGGAHLRYFGPRPLIEDNSVQSKATSLVSARIGYKLTDTTRLRLEIFNLLDARASQIDYYYASRLPGESAAGVNDIHLHPVEPLSLRATLTASF
jgi:outer membrane cobalamin receptor